MQRQKTFTTVATVVFNYFEPGTFVTPTSLCGPLKFGTVYKVRKTWEPLCIEDEGASVSLEGWVGTRSTKHLREATEDEIAAASKPGEPETFKYFEPGTYVTLTFTPSLLEPGEVYKVLEWRTPLYAGGAAEVLLEGWAATVSTEHLREATEDEIAAASKPGEPETFNYFEPGTYVTATSRHDFLEPGAIYKVQWRTPLKSGCWVRAAVEVTVEGQTDCQPSTSGKQPKMKLQPRN